MNKANKAKVTLAIIGILTTASIQILDTLKRKD